MIFLQAKYTWFQRRQYGFVSLVNVLSEHEGQYSVIMIWR